MVSPDFGETAQFIGSLDHGFIFHHHLLEILVCFGVCSGRFGFLLDYEDCHSISLLCLLEISNSQSADGMSCPADIVSLSTLLLSNFIECVLNVSAYVFFPYLTSC